MLYYYIHICNFLFHNGISILLFFFLVSSYNPQGHNYIQDFGKGQGRGFVSLPQEEERGGGGAGGLTPGLWTPVPGTPAPAPVPAPVV